MIIEDEKNLNLEFFFDNVGTRVKPSRNPNKIQTFLETFRNIENADTHKQLKEDLVQHHWQGMVVDSATLLLFHFIFIHV
jgi:hypothetical protein